MQGLTNKLERTRRCGFCRSTEHAIVDCDVIEPVWSHLEKGIIPLSMLGGALSYYQRGKNWGTLYKDAERYHETWKEAQRRKKVPKSARTRAKSKCGFCGSTDHTRRTCDKLKLWKPRLEAANQNFRNWFYEKYVAEKGLSNGAIFEFTLKAQLRYAQEPETNTYRQLITDVNFGTINLFSAYLSPTTRSYDEREVINKINQYVKSPVTLKIPAGSAAQKMISTASWAIRSDDDCWISLPVISAQSGEVLYRSYDGLKTHTGRNIEISDITVVSRSPSVPEKQQWIAGYADEVSTIFKKFSLEQLQAAKITELILEWAE